jgi:hypothetical protein
MRPVGELYKPGYLGSISDPSSMIENTVLAASLAFEMLGIWLMLTPEPIAPTNTT